MGPRETGLVATLFPVRDWPPLGTDGYLVERAHRSPLHHRNISPSAPDTLVRPLQTTPAPVSSSPPTTRPSIQQPSIAPALAPTQLPLQPTGPPTAPPSAPSPDDGESNLDLESPDPDLDDQALSPSLSVAENYHSLHWRILSLIAT